MEIRLVAKGKPAPGTVKNSFKQNIKYQTHIQDIGWQDYVNSGELSRHYWKKFKTRRNSY